MAAYIEFRACAGLGNRLRALVSAILFAEDEERPLHIIWNKDSHCGAFFHELFDMVSLPKFVTVDDILPTNPSKEVRTEKDLIAYKDLDKSIPIYIHSHQAFYDNEDVPRWLSCLRSMKPAEFIALTLQKKLMRAPAGPHIGVHIRRTDHRKSIRTSPTESFIRFMKKCDPSCIFILATDSSEERAVMEEKFPDRIFCLSAVYDRNNTFGVQTALLDFLALASCEKIIGSFDSSFSEMAAMYGGKPMVIARRD